MGISVRASIYHPQPTLPTRPRLTDHIQTRPCRPIRALRRIVSTSLCTCQSHTPPDAASATPGCAPPPALAFLAVSRGPDAAHAIVRAVFFLLDEEQCCGLGGRWDARGRLAGPLPRAFSPLGGCVAATSSQWGPPSRAAHVGFGPYREVAGGDARQIGFSSRRSRGKEVGAVCRGPPAKSASVDRMCTMSSLRLRLTSPSDRSRAVSLRLTLSAAPTRTQIQECTLLHPPLSALLTA